MIPMTEIDPVVVQARWRDALARKLVAAGLAVVAAEQEALSVATGRNGPGAPKGEHPRFRSGFGRANVAYEPTDFAEIRRTLRLKLGYRKPGFYLGVLGTKGWKWLADTVAANRARIAAALAGTA